MTFLAFNFRVESGESGKVRCEKRVFKHCGLLKKKKAEDKKISFSRRYSYGYLLFINCLAFKSKQRYISWSWQRGSLQSTELKCFLRM